MLTIFTTFKPFRDPHIAMIQKNALKSWVAIRPHCEVILLGRDEGVAQIAKKFNVRHIPNIKVVNGKLPLISSLFTEAQSVARFPFLCYLNGDIILLNDFLKAVKRITKEYQSFLAVGRRWDVDISAPLSFKGKWQQELKTLISQQGTLHGVSGIDYFVFPKGLFSDIPPLVVGRGGWDNWMIFHARMQRIPVIDLTDVTMVVHQEHDLAGTREKAIRFTDDEAQQNLRYAGGYKNLLTIRDATLHVTPKGIKRNWYSFLSLFYPWQLLLLCKRKLQHFTI